MKRTSKHALKWFRVHQGKLMGCRKFEALDHTECGCLFKFWILAYSNKLDVGTLPSIQIIAKFLAGGYKKNPSRVISLLERFVQYDWLDRFTRDGSPEVYYKLHDWEFWQFCDDPQHDGIAPRGALDYSILEVCPTRAPHVPRGVESDADSKALISYRVQRTEVIEDKEGDTSNPHFDLESLINAPPIQPELFKNALVQTEKDDLHNSVYKDLLAHIETSWQSERKFPLKSVCSKSDYAELHRMLRRVLPAMIPVSALLAAWNRFLLSPDKWNRKQGHPIRYWCNNLSAFMADDNAKEQPRVESKSERAYRETMALMLRLEVEDKTNK